MTTPDVSAAQSRNGSTAAWILSPWQDLSFFIATPLLIIPLGLLSRDFVPPATFYAVVLALGATGHHLPGMIRAYDDRDLFKRFRVRFTVAPIVLVAVSVACVYWRLSCIYFLLIIWAMWHPLAQIYGFLRIYDAKAGVRSVWAGRADLAVWGVWFAAAVLHSPDQLFNVFSEYYAAGGPRLSAAAVTGLRSACDVGVVIVTLAYLGYVASTWSQGERSRLAKYLLLIVSVVFFWYALTAIRPLILGAALLEIFHDVQYLAVVWSFNRTSVATGRDVGTVTRSLFRHGAGLVALYVLACFAYGSLGFGRSLPGEPLHSIVVGVLIASALLHYYYDGFIWKLRDRTISQGLQLTAAGAGPSAFPSGLTHGLKWAAVAVPMGVLAFAQLHGNADPVSRAQAIAATIPWNSAAQRGLGNVLNEHGEVAGATVAYQRALEIDPEDAESHTNLGMVLQGQGRDDEAASHYLAALESNPRYAMAHNNLAADLWRRGRVADAAEHYRRAISFDPDLALAQYNLAKLLLQQGRLVEARPYLERTIALEPGNAAARQDLALVERTSESH